ncbi:MAG: hypothetical protein WBP93_02370 [Pyrinomonadaceae bacterium]
MSKLVRIFLPCLLLLLPCCLTAYSQAQQPIPDIIPQTKIEAFQYQTGAVIIKAFTRIGAMRGTGGTVEVTSIEFTEARSGRKEQGIVVDVKEFGRGERSERSYIDDEEIAPLLRAIDDISKIGTDVTKLANFEARYTTRGDFSIATFNEAETINVAIGGGHVTRVEAVFKFVDLEKFKGLLLSAKSRLDAAK